MKLARQFLALSLLIASLAWAQGNKGAVPPPAPVEVEQPDAQRIQQELSNLLQRYPPNLRAILALDPSLLSNQSYLAPYPALGRFLNGHPEIVRNPAFYIGEPQPDQLLHDRLIQDGRGAEEIVNDIAIFAGFALAISLIAWLIRTFIDYRRWNRLTNIQTEVHTRLLDRFTSNEDLLAYVNSQAGSKFLESSPIALNAPRSISGPMGRVLWTLQAGVVVIAAGLGLNAISGRVPYEVGQALRALGILGVALGVGLVASAVISFLLSRRLGLIERQAPGAPQPTENR